MARKTSKDQPSVGHNLLSVRDQQKMPTPSLRQMLHRLSFDYPREAALAMPPIDRVQANFMGESFEAMHRRSQLQQNIPNAGFIADFGEEFVGSQRPPDIRLRALGKCFVNAAGLMWKHEDNHGGDLTYVEGFAYEPEIGPFLHAWCVRGDLVVDPTLRDPEKYQYLGIRI